MTPPLFSAPLVRRSSRLGALLAIGVLSATFAGAQSSRISVGAIGIGPIRSAVGEALPDSVVSAIATSRLVQNAAPSEMIDATISLQPRDLAGLTEFVDAASNPASPTYRQFLTPEQIGERFGASLADRNAVSDFLRNSGLQVTEVAPNGLAVSVKGSIARFESAFGTDIAYFRGNDPDGKTITYRANLSRLLVPASLSRIVAYVSGISNYNRPHRRATTTTLSPKLITVGFNLQPSFTLNHKGLGRHVAISNFDGFRLSDAVTYATYFGLPLPPTGAGSNVVVRVAGTGTAGQEAGGEGDLDIQMVLGQAPLANIRVYDNGTSDLLAILNAESTDNWADVVTESYGWSGNGTFWNSCHNVHLALSAQGITYMAASGDSGTNFGNYPYPDFDPEVLMVGGSILTVDSTTGVRQGEIGWNYGGGGWYNSPVDVTWNTLPTWQKGTNVPTNVNRRLVPDVAFAAGGSNTPSTDPGCALVFYTDAGTQGLYGFSGTSAASPMFAGMLGTVEGRLFSTADSRRRQRLGRIQDLIYSQNGRTDVYNDITVGTIGRLPTSSTGTSNAHAGAVTAAGAQWDYCTGWGSVNEEGLFRSLANGANP